jgi:polyisoprenoid-binding protein YceI
MRKTLVLAAALLLTLTVGAQAETYKIDAGHSSIGFSVRHMAISKVKGSFNEFSGTVEYDADDKSQWATNVEIQTASVDTRSENRDEHLRSDDFFAVDSFPTMTFKSTGMIPGEDGMFQLTGEFTMLGVTKSVTLDVELGGTMTDGRGNKRLGLSATTTIDRIEYGMSPSKVLDTGGLMLGHDIEITIDLEAIWRAPKPPEEEEDKG